MTLATNALTTYATIKAELGLTDDTQQTYLEKSINVVSQAMENYCNRKFKKQTFTDEMYEGNNRKELLLKNYPIISVTKVIVNDTEIELTEIEIDYEKGILYCEDLFTSRGELEGVSNFETLPDRNIKVTYEAGYILPKDEVLPGTLRTLPYDLEQVAIDEVVGKYESKGTSKNVTGWSLGGASKSFGENKDANSGMLINSTILLGGTYRRWNI